MEDNNSNQNSEETKKIENIPPVDESKPSKPPKKKTWLILTIVLIVILLLTCICLGSYLAFNYYHDSIVEVEKKNKELEKENKEKALELQEEMLGEDTTDDEPDSANQKDDAETGGEYTFSSKNGGSAEVMVLKEIRFGNHIEFERVVLEFAPQKNNPVNEVPRYIIQPGKLPYNDPDGKLVAIKGSNYIQVLYNGNLADLSQDSAPKIYNGPENFNLNYKVIKQAKFVPAYENNSLILLLGLDYNAPYRVTELTKPSRIVIDVKK